MSASPSAPPAAPSPLRALLVDDEAPTLSELAYLLGRDDRVGQIHTASSGTEALKALDTHQIDVIFTDISMPDLDGLALARVLARFAERPQVVFVTAYDEHAVAAFELEATDYVMKPVRAERLSDAVRRVVAQRAEPRTTSVPVPEPSTDETIPVELGGVTTFVQRSQIIYAQAQGDYARLHTPKGSHLVRISLNSLEERWGESGFVRIHRSTLVSTSPHHGGDGAGRPMQGAARRRGRTRSQPTAYPRLCATGSSVRRQRAARAPDRARRLPRLDTDNLHSGTDAMADTTPPPKRVRITSPRRDARTTRRKTFLTQSNSANKPASARST
jgi:DNA-binding LytR/AlgR family response regulator